MAPLSLRDVELGDGLDVASGVRDAHDAARISCRPVYASVRRPVSAMERVVLDERERSASGKCGLEEWPHGRQDGVALNERQCRAVRRKQRRATKTRRG